MFSAPFFFFLYSVESFGKQKTSLAIFFSLNYFCCSLVLAWYQRQINGGGKEGNLCGDKRCIRAVVATASALHVSLPLVIWAEQTETRVECMFFFLHLLFLLYPCALSFLLFFWASNPIGTVHPFHNQSFEGELTKTQPDLQFMMLKTVPYVDYFKKSLRNVLCKFCVSFLWNVSLWSEVFVLFF